MRRVTLHRRKIASRGFTLLEVMLAFVIFALSFAVVLEILAGSISGQVGMVDLISVAAAEPYADRLERVAVEDLARLFDGHDPRIRLPWVAIKTGAHFLSIRGCGRRQWQIANQRCYVSVALTRALFWRRRLPRARFAAPWATIHHPFGVQRGPSTLPLGLERFVT